MSASYRRLAFGFAAIGALALASCTTNTPGPQEATAPPPMTQPAIPSKYQPEDIVGRWGYGAFHREGDLARTESEGYVVLLAALSRTMSRRSFTCAARSVAAVCSGISNRAFP